MTSLQTSSTRMRDPRLDFFRGLGMFIIFMAHMPQNYWSNILPGRFGFSDATEIFVFCSGIACAIAFGKIFDAKGWLLGSARMLYRVWQIYWVHIGLFISLAMLMVFMDNLQLINKEHVKSLNLHMFFDSGPQNVLALMTLSYVPNYFDILPMYIVILLLVPVILGIKKYFGTAPALGGVLLLWLASQIAIPAFGWLHLPAEPWSDRTWYFNPFAWQMIFFTGYAFMAGWLPLPPINKYMIALAIGCVVLSLPLAWHVLVDALPLAQKVRGSLEPYIQKTNFGFLRYMHFLALAYLAWIIAGPQGIRLRPRGQARYAVDAIHKVGQQSLATFVTGMIIAQPLGTFLDLFGRGFLSHALANLSGCLIMVAVAYSIGWMKSNPWKISLENKIRQDNEKENKENYVPVAAALYSMPQRKPAQTNIMSDENVPVKKQARR